MSFALRPYQIEAVERVFGEFERVRSTLVVMPTGTGKTVVFAAVAQRFRPRGRVLVVAHREELIRQAADKIERSTSLKASIEMGDERAAGGLFASDVVVATIQTLAHARRREAFAPDAFGLIVIDEAHHATAQSYRAVMDYFAGAKVLGVTATPDRSDGGGLGEVFESVAFVYGIRDAIDEGHLVPIRQKAVAVDGLDLSRVRTTAGDLNEGDLEEVLNQEQNLHGVAHPTVELAGDRPTIVFGATVEHAHRLAEVIGRHIGDENAVRALDGSADKQLRRDTLAAFAAGRFQFLVNCALFTEGFDEPSVACVAVARPTKSRGLYTQMVGRGTRLHPGKGDLLVLDFEGNAGRHSLVTAADILGASEDPEVMARAKELAASGERAVHEALDQARAEAAGAARKKVIAEARFKAVEIDPFQILGAKTRKTWWSGHEPTEKQVALLEKSGIKGIKTKGEASALIDQILGRQKAGLCTFKQARQLAKYGLNPDVTFDEARALMDRIAANGWRLPADLRAA